MSDRTPPLKRYLIFYHIEIILSRYRKNKRYSERTKSNGRMITDRERIEKLKGELVDRKQKFHIECIMLPTPFFEEGIEPKLHFGDWLG